MSVSKAVNIADLRLMAMRRLPRMVFDYIDGGAEREWTLRENMRAFEDVMFRPRSAVATAAVDLSTTVLGMKIDVPFILAPVGSSRMFYPRGEEVAASVAGRAGTIYTLSTLSGCRMEDVKAATTGPAWFQLYLVGGRDIALKAIARAKACGYKALVVTIDTPVAGMRERDSRNGVKELLALDLSTVPYLGQMIAKPRWLYKFFGDGGLMSFPNIVIDNAPMGYADVGAALEASMTSWKDFQWIREAWAGRSSSRACTRRMMRDMRSTKAPQPSSSRITAPGSSMASRRRSACCRRSWTQSAAASKCCSTAASAAAATSSRRWPWAPAPC